MQLLDRIHRLTEVLRAGALITSIFVVLSVTSYGQNASLRLLPSDSMRVPVMQGGTYDTRSISVWFLDPTINKPFECAYWDGVYGIPNGVMPMDSVILNTSVLNTLKQLGVLTMQQYTDFSPCRDSLSFTRYGDTIPTPHFWNSFFISLRDTNAAQAVAELSFLYGGSAIDYAELNGSPTCDTCASLVSERGVNMPGAISIEQNSPNPFTGTTAIHFTLQQASRLSLTIFNNLGVEVATPFSEKFDAGRHSVNIDLTSLRSGNYIYRLSTGTSARMGTMSVLH